MRLRRGFKNSALATARGFGKRSQEMVNTNWPTFRGEDQDKDIHNYVQDKDMHNYVYKLDYKPRQGNDEVGRFDNEHASKVMKLKDAQAVNSQGVSKQSLDR